MTVVFHCLFAFQLLNFACLGDLSSDGGTGINAKALEASISNQLEESKARSAKLLRRLYRDAGDLIDEFSDSDEEFRSLKAEVMENRSALLKEEVYGTMSKIANDIQEKLSELKELSPEAQFLSLAHFLNFMQQIETKFEEYINLLKVKLQEVADRLRAGMDSIQRNKAEEEVTKTASQLEAGVRATLMHLKGIITEQMQKLKADLDERQPKSGDTNASTGTVIAADLDERQPKSGDTNASTRARLKHQPAQNAIICIVLLATIFNRFFEAARPE